jgi:hypothetical protein
MSPTAVPPINLPIPTLPSFQYGDGPDSISLLDPLGPFWADALRWSLQMWCVPSTAVLLANTPAGLTAYQNIEDSIIVPAGSFLLGFSSFSAQAAGFRWRIWDVGANAYALSDRWLNNVTDGQDNSDTDAAVPNVLPDPYCIVSPGELHIQLVNSASVSNDIGLIVWIAKPNNGQVIP